MQKKLLVILLILCLLPAAALADVHVEETPPEDWAERDLMRLTVLFGAIGGHPAHFLLFHDACICQNFSHREDTLSSKA